jgi:cell division protein FtsB
VRWLLLVLICLLCVLQYRLWFADGSLAERQRLQRQIQQAEVENERLRERNSLLAREVLDLQSGKAVVEQRAREELNLVREGEVYYQFLEDGRTGSAPEAP